MSELSEHAIHVVTSLATSAAVYEWKPIAVIVPANLVEGQDDPRTFISEGVLVLGHLVERDNTIELRRLIELETGYVHSLLWRPFGTTDWTAIPIDITDLRGGDTQ